MTKTNTLTYLYLHRRLCTTVVCWLKNNKMLQKEVFGMDIFPDSNQRNL